MGQFVFQLDAIGGHGCQRERGDGDFVVGCEQSHCTDCITREYVRRLKRTGAMINSAKLVHWPGTKEQVVDDLVSGKRQSNFPEYERYNSRQG